MHFRVFRCGQVRKFHNMLKASIPDEWENLISMTYLKVVVDHVRNGERHHNLGMWVYKIESGKLRASEKESGLGFISWNV